MERKLPKPKRCGNKTCKDKFTPHPARPLQEVCSPLCGLELTRYRAEKKAQKEAKEKKAELREKTKTLTEYESEAKTAFQKWIRMRDADLPCISCGTYTAYPCFDGGHFYKAELFSGLIFDERNCSKQCRRCNKHLQGNQLEYRKELVRRHGEEWVKQLDEDSITKRVYKYTKNELIAKKLQYELKIKEFKKN